MCPTTIPSRPSSVLPEDGLIKGMLLSHHVCYIHTGRSSPTLLVSITSRLRGLLSDQFKAMKDGGAAVTKTATQTERLQAASCSKRIQTNKDSPASEIGGTCPRLPALPGGLRGRGFLQEVWKNSAFFCTTAALSRTQSQHRFRGGVCGVRSGLCSPTGGFLVCFFIVAQCEEVQQYVCVSTR